VDAGVCAVRSGFRRVPADEGDGHLNLPSRSGRVKEAGVPREAGKCRECEPPRRLGMLAGEIPTSGREQEFFFRGGLDIGIFVLYIL
jgi:hypothetical protein